MDTAAWPQILKSRRLRRRDLLRGAGATAASFWTASLLAACQQRPLVPASTSADVPKRGGTLRIALANEIAGVDPYGSTSVSDKSVYHAVYDGLVALDRDLRVIPQLATSWLMPDDRTYVFTLRDGVTFHDGTPLDAAAVKQSFDWLLDPVNASQARPELSEVQDVLAPNSRTVTFRLKTPSSVLLTSLADRAGKVVSPTARARYGKDLALHPVGTGPFRFVEWVQDDHLSLKRFDEYWDKGNPSLNAVTFRPIPDASVALTELKTGNIDVVAFLDPKDLPEVRGAKDLVALETPGLNFWGICPNTTRGPLASRPLREALSLAIDRDAVLAGAAFGVGQVAHGPIPPSSFAFDANAPVIHRDVERARARLAEGGQPNGFAVKLLCSPPGKQIAQVAQAQAKEVGIDLQIQVLESTAFLAIAQGSDNEAVVLGWGGRTDPDGNVFPLFHTKGGWNGGKYSNPEVDRLIEQGRVESNQAERKRIYQSIQQLLNQDVAYIFTIFRPVLHATSASVRGLEPMADQALRLQTTSLTTT
jgi:peptide/nickel transport system substrate-binding protein